MTNILKNDQSVKYIFVRNGGISKIKNKIVIHRIKVNMNYDANQFLSFDVSK